ncbi:circularly permutated Ras protein 1-like [Erpetoichthys calabaricus]|uniref:circularly permutated Ras protein 1-like n=1 Tax=Erpetoichthys calabaricus TaxID=27687 RepID=UPI0022341B8B|nr:circularly permutated Ras protein 1-like [Erpetoichthys calabaricus]
MEFASDFIFLPPLKSTWCSGYDNVNSGQQYQEKKHQTPGKLQKYSNLPNSDTLSTHDSSICEDALQSFPVNTHTQNSSPYCLTQHPGESEQIYDTVKEPLSVYDKVEEQTEYDLPEGLEHKCLPKQTPEKGLSPTLQQGQSTNDHRQKQPAAATQGGPPPLPPRPPSMINKCHYYTEVLSEEPISTCMNTQAPVPQSAPLLGNVNILLVNLGKMVDTTTSIPISGEPSYCSACRAALELKDNSLKASECMFCCNSAYQVKREPFAAVDQLFMMTPNFEVQSFIGDSIIVFCVDISGSMSVTSKVPEGGKTLYMSRLQAVQEAVTQSLSYLDNAAPFKRVALVSFNHKVTVYGDGSSFPQVVEDFELVDSDHLRNIGLSQPLPGSVKHAKMQLKDAVYRLNESGSTALGPAALISIALASQRPGSKVIICTDGKANTDLGNLEDVCSEELEASKQFYNQLAEYARQQGVVVSVLTFLGTDCSLSEIGKLADCTGGKVNTVQPGSLYDEIQNILEDQVLATNVETTCILPPGMYFKHEDNKDSTLLRTVGNVTRDTEITFEFGTTEEMYQAILSMSPIPVQLQVKFSLTGGKAGVRVLTVYRPVTTDSAVVESSISLPVLQVHSSQLSARLAMDGKFEEAQREAVSHKAVIEAVLAKQENSTEPAVYQEWVDAMSPMYGNLHDYVQPNQRTIPGKESKLKSFTDEIASLMFQLKNAKKKMMKKRNEVEKANLFNPQTKS